MITSDTLRGYNEMFILYVLIENDSYGYEISKEIERVAGGRYTIKETTLYSAFTRLEANGHVASYYGNETFGKRRTYYKITKEGRALYQSKCKEWAQAKTVIDRFVVEEEKENGSN